MFNIYELTIKSSKVIEVTSVLTPQSVGKVIEAFLYEWPCKKEVTINLKGLKDEVTFCPEGLELWTADTCAEVLPNMLNSGLYTRLWEISSEANDPTPLGGNGSNGTVEEPSGRLDSHNDDKAKNFWDKLTVSERMTLAVAFTKYDAKFVGGL